MENSTKDKIQKLIDSNSVMVFMKGTKLMPQCGFSNNVVQILNSLGVEFNTFDVLSDYEVREGIKEYSDWPTIPQVYLKGEFLGGSDILIEMYNSGTLKEKIEIETISAFLPKQLSVEETKKICEETIKKINATSIKDMGKVMG